MERLKRVSLSLYIRGIRRACSLAQTFVRSHSGRLVLLLASPFLFKCLIVVLWGPQYDYASDDRGYLESARILAEEGRLTYLDPQRPTLFITPALPGLLALISKLIGGDEVLAQTFRMLQAGMVMVSLYVLYRIAVRLAGHRTAMRTVALISFYPPLWLMSMFVFTESLFLLALLVLVAALLKVMERPSTRTAAVFGLTWAAAVYVRPTIALWPGLVLPYVIWLRVRWRRASGVRREEGTQPTRVGFLLNVGEAGQPTPAGFVSREAGLLHMTWLRLMRCALTAALVFALCLSPWWVRNYRVTGGEFVPLTRSGGNPLLLGTYPFTVPALFMEEQRTWHTTSDQQVNDAQDMARAKVRVKEGFGREPLLYISWYAIGKPLLFWGDVFYWRSLPGVPLAIAVIYHYALLFLAVRGIRLRGRQEYQPGPGIIHPHGLEPDYQPVHLPGLRLILLLFLYMTVLHAVYLSHSRYSVPLIPLVAIFAAMGLRDRLPFSKRCVKHE